MSISDEIKKVIREVPDFPTPGVNFKDITPIFENPDLCKKIVQAFISQLPEKPDAVIGIESRGFLFGFVLAYELQVPFILARKAGKLPYKTVKAEYNLEYGSAAIEINENSISKGQKILIHDDLLATGGTASAAAHLVKLHDADVLAFTFLIELSFLKGKEKLKNYTNNIICLTQY
ncbi:MAG TPA: adenine phosphoribosyltransferase [Bacteroidia bacterium]|jgi:adenine phosphoribosyltransferase|nr:adenine phosphoribosyltransferase [Bacteroidia bacterium]